MRVEVIDTSPVDTTIRARGDDRQVIVLRLGMDAIEGAVRRELSEDEVRRFFEARFATIERVIEDKYRRGEVTSNPNVRVQHPEGGGVGVYRGGPYLEMSFTDEELRTALANG